MQVFGGKVSSWIIEESAHWIAADMHIRANQEGWRFDEVSDLEKLVRSYGARVDNYADIGGEPGAYYLDSFTIAYNTTRTPLRQCVTIVHEAGHHIVWTWVPPRLRTGADSLRYDDTFIEFQHCVAYHLQGLIYMPLYPLLPVWHPSGGHHAPICHEKHLANLNSPRS